MFQIIFRFFLPIVFLASFAFATNIACVGNSITAGYGLLYQEDYPAQWQKLLGTTDYTVSNFGVSSTTLLKQGDNPYWNQYALTNARASSPHAVVVELGTNDTKLANWYNHRDEFPEDYKSLIDTFLILDSQPRIWICLAPYSNNEGWGIRDTSITLRINPDILQVGLDKGVNIIDLHSTFTDKSWFASDSVNPNAVGAAALAAIINGFFQRDTLQITRSGNLLSAPAGYAFQWYLNDTPIASAVSNTLTISSTGTYKVSVKVDPENDSRLVTKEMVVTSLDDPSSLMVGKKQIKTNVKNKKCHITLPQSMNIRADLFDMHGRLIKKINWTGIKGENSFTLPTASTPRMLRVTVGTTSQLFFLPVSQ
jgi:lysophospholipase L1-like esterase